MTAPKAGGPPIRIQASGSILNPWYDLPVSLRGTWEDAPENRPQITPPCRIDLRPLGIDLFFRHDEMAFFFTDDRPGPRYLINPIQYFVCYRTFINYNLIGFATNRADYDGLGECDRVRFRVEQIVRVERPDPAGPGLLFHHEGREAWLEIATASIKEYLRVLNPTVYYALAFYLIGCQNPRYFLVEFYKSIEVITNSFGGQDALLDALKPHGVTKTSFKEFGKVANDMRLAPLDIGRHAPVPGAPVYTVDLRHLLVEPRSREVFESATVFCRQLIDAYIAYLVQRADAPSNA